ncbi:neutral zinc metallopeptidase [Cellulomonas sp. Sa3CUA2]|uniref:Neutral zinc metallopeptidase n=1 Tax=Cellulomonas avistercoris TaxID=2762242 RepID=A0ABR8Q8D3_9CELL|nr:neutral zinc metallopeptidase [Cellulomonas avistercoris]MBD7916691.1 neutral zinc metallopeptidase [Cellulomonas avistercoris]
MTFSDGGDFQGGRVKRGGGGRAVAGGGGLIGIIALAIYLFTGQDVSGVIGGGSEPDPAAGGNLVDSCTVEQANTDPACRLEVTVQALDTYWGAQVPAAGATFAQPGVQAFSDNVSTACGAATSATGPFYCPPDQTVYIDLAFFATLQQQFGAQGGPLAEMYVYAHEYGHHVQNLTGVFDAADRSGGGAESDSVRVELQADCYAGMWAGDATETVRPGTDTPYLEPITAEELAQALDAAAAVGDDHIQQQSGGGVDPDTWTHGSSEQRQKWFTIGYEQGSLAACDTFAATDL